MVYKNATRNKGKEVVNINYELAAQIETQELSKISEMVGRF